MANTQLSAAQLFGTYSTFSPRTNSRPRVGYQEFAFAGIDGCFATAMGEHGTEIAWSGILRTDPALTTQSAAGTALNALAATIRGYQRDGTIIDLFVSDTTGLSYLYAAAAYTNLVIRDFNERGKRGFTYPASGKVQAWTEFDIMFLKLF